MRVIAQPSVCFSHRFEFKVGRWHGDSEFGLHIHMLLTVLGVDVGQGRWGREDCEAGSRIGEWECKRNEHGRMSSR